MNSLEPGGHLLWAERLIDAPAATVWRLFTDLDRWPEWGPSITAAGLDGPRFEAGTTGWVRTVLGVRLVFEITGYEEGHEWAWKVSGVPATTHRVVELDGSSCRAGFGVPALAAPYLLVCRQALARIDRIATSA